MVRAGWADDRKPNVSKLQGAAQTEFAERMFVYHYRIYDHYRRPVASMAVLADEQPDWKPDRFGYEVLGCRQTLEFPVAKLTDYRPQLETLLASGNAFAIITAGHILTQRTRKNPQARYDEKYRLLRLLYQQRGDRQRVIDLFYVLDWLMRLPELLERQLRTEIEALEEREDMRYVTSFERFAKEEGRQEGRQEGLLAGEGKLLKKQLERRFGDLPVWATDKLLVANEQDLERWGELVLTMPSLHAVFNEKATH